MAEMLYSKKEDFLLKFKQGSEIDLSSDNLEYDPLFFTQLVAKSFDRRKLNLQDHFFPALHLTNILEKKAKKSIEFLGIEEYFSDLIMKLEKKPESRRYLSISFADDVLFFNGLFPRSFHKSFRNPTFYVDMAKLFYTVESSHMENLSYYEIGSNIETYLSILRQTKRIIKEMEPDTHEKFLIFIKNQS